MFTYIFRTFSANAHCKPVQYIVTENGCHECVSHVVDTHGYPQIVREGIKLPGHRLLWIDSHGPLNREECVMHACDNRKCINLLHLSIGTNAENIADMKAKDRTAKGVDNGSAKLNEEKVKEIRESKLPYRTLAVIYGVSFGHIANIRARRVWDWI